MGSCLLAHLISELYYNTEGYSWWEKELCPVVQSYW